MPETTPENIDREHLERVAAYLKGLSVKMLKDVLAIAVQARDGAYARATAPGGNPLLYTTSAQAQTQVIRWVSEELERRGEAKVVGDVPSSSVRSSLQTERYFERVRRGEYRLRSH